MTCRATIAGEPVHGQGSWVPLLLVPRISPAGDVASPFGYKGLTFCSWEVPKTAKGKLLKGRMRAQKEGLSVSRSFSVRIGSRGFCSTTGMLRRRLARLFLGGTDGNERLTANTAAILIVLLAVEAATLLSLRSLLPVHVFVGMLLIPPVALKLASTGYRFLRYYRRAPEYVSKGPPMLLMRMVVAPFVVATTVALFASGVALIVLGPKSDVVLNVHKASFILWVGAMSIHVLAYVRRLPPLLRRDSTPGLVLRAALVGGALMAGVLLAVATYPLADTWYDRMRGDHDQQEASAPVAGK